MICFQLVSSDSTIHMNVYAYWALAHQFTRVQVTQVNVQLPSNSIAGLDAGRGAEEGHGYVGVAPTSRFMFIAAYLYN